MSLLTPNESAAVVRAAANGPADDHQWRALRAALMSTPDI